MSNLSYSKGKTTELPASSPVELLLQATKKFPNNIAFVSGSKSITFIEFHKKSDALATWLKNSNASGNIGVMFERGLDYYIAIMGILKAGCTYVTIDKTYPKERIDYIKNDSKINICLTELPGNYESEIVENLNKKIDDYKLSEYSSVIYTSGSTGNPKGVLIGQSSAINFSNYYIKEKQITQDSILASYANFSFAVSLIDFITPLISGAQLHIIGNDIRLEFSKVEKYFNDNKITHCYLPTSFARLFAEKANIESLKAISMAGERYIPIPYTANKNLSINNSYGSTEAVSCVTYKEMSVDSDSTAIGTVVDNTELKIVDENGNTVKIGELGELCIKSEFNSKGYLGLEEKWNEVFYDDYYHSGDLATMDSDGSITVSGRKDFQVKIRGFRVELSEIDTTLLALDNVKEAVSIAATGSDGEKRILTYFSKPLEIKEVDIDYLKDYISKKLPSYMIPSAIIELDNIPKNPNGKIDRKALPAELSTKDIVNPSTELESKIRDIYAKVLKIESSKISIDEPLEFYGMHSLLAFQISAELEAVFEISLSTTKILGAKTIKNLSKVVEVSPKSEKLVHKIKDTYSLSDEQIRYYSYYKNEPENSLQVSILLEFEKNISAKAVQNAMTNVINAHSFLKTTLIETPEPKWKRNDDLVPVIPIFDNATEKDIDKAMYKHIAPIPLVNNKLYNSEIYVVNGITNLFISINHIIYDGASMELLFSDIAKSLEGIEVLDDKIIAFEVGDQEKSERTGERWLEAKTHFESFLKKSEILELADEVSIERQLMPIEEIDEFLKNKKYTSSDFFLSALISALGELEGTKTYEGSITMDEAGRHTLDRKSSVGLFVRTVPMAFSNPFPEAIHEDVRKFLDYDTYTLECARKIGVVPQVNYIFQGDLDFGLANGPELPAQKHLEKTSEIYFGKNYTYMKIGLDFLVMKYDSPLIGGHKYVLNTTFRNEKFVGLCEIIKSKVENILNGV
jgi:gramicidin S synthase 2